MGRRKLTNKEETRIRIAIRDRVMHFSPTISPAPKNEERGEIESIASALDFYTEAGVTKVIIQPKYMGSYCDIYLRHNVEESRFFSRRGYSITPRLLNQEDLVKAVRPLHERFDWDGVELRIIQAELLPWAALGKGLIIRDFGGYGLCHASHSFYLGKTGLRDKLGQLTADPEFRQFLVDSTMLSKKQLDKKYKQHVRRQYEALRTLSIPNVEEYDEAIDLYREQLELYGYDGELEFKPFNILKTVYADGGEEVNQDNIGAFQDVSDDAHYVANLSTGTGYVIDEGSYPVPEPAVEGAYNFFNGLVADKMEGVVIKPAQVWDSKMVPMFKVRNNNYLQLIYGVRFNAEYDYYLRRRKVGRKMRCSRNEWNIAQSLLRIPMSEIGPDNETYYKFVRKRILEEDFEATLDSRL